MERVRWQGKKGQILPSETKILRQSSMHFLSSPQLGKPNQLAVNLCPHSPRGIRGGGKLVRSTRVSESDGHVVVKKKLEIMRGGSQ